MLRRFVALVAKELREHALVLALLVPLLGLAMAVVTLASLAATRSISLLEAALSFTITFVPLVGMGLGHRLIVVEYQGRTQLFVEALPVRRWEMVAVKYGLGLGLLLFISLGGLAWCAALAGRSEPVEARFLGILGARTAAFTWCVWSFLFGMAFTGRYRIPIYIGIGLGLLVLSNTTELDLTHFGPFELMSSSTFSTERHELPRQALLVTAGVATGWMALATFLAVLREGSAAEVLSRPMSQKEKSVIAVLVIAGLIAAMELDQRKQKAPFAFTDPAVLRHPTQPVEVLYATEAARANGQALLEALAGDREALAALLPQARLPVVRVALRASLDARTFETARLEENDGVLVRANFRRPPGASFEDDDELRALRAHVLREVLQEALLGRATLESKRWLHDGFSRWFVERGRGRPAAPLDPAASRPLLRALWATRGRPPRGDDLARWDVFRERSGELVAEGVAFSGLWALEVERGPEAVLGLARSAFDRVASRDVREVLWERAHPTAALVEAACGSPQDEWVARWGARLDEVRAAPPVRAVLDALPEGTGRLTVERGEGELRVVSYAFEFTRPPAPGTLCALVHCPLEPFDRELEPHELERQEHFWPEDRTAIAPAWRLEGRHGAGSRAFLALEVELEALGASVRLAAERREIP